MATAKEAEAAAYRDGYRAGYAKGIEDGAGQGYADAKARTWAAHDVMSASGSFTRETLGRVSHHLTALVGQRT